ncbi:hypothetical protein C8R46DRAFT_1064127 [Mycena filopes]|nr:hypothetical protein C8R46DRAFT_1064127 [Mycena filopes]
MPIVEALATRNVSVVLFSRPGSSKKTVPSGVKVAELDFTDVGAVSAALRKHGVDVVLSTIATAGTAGQLVLADAAKLAGVKLFAPAEYGLPTDAAAEGPLGEKKRVAEYLKAQGIPTVRFYTGVFIEFIPWLTGYPEHNKIQIVGKGEAPASFTAIADIAGFVAHVLTTLPPAELENRVFRLEGERRSLKDLARLLNTTIEHLERIPGEMGEFKTRLSAAVSLGAGSTGWDMAAKREGTGANAAGSANVLWPDHQWKSIKEVLQV